jgi:hypothetical protein
VTPSQTLEYLKIAIPKRENVILISDPGMGKSEITAQACEAVGYDMVVSNPGIEDPTEPGGFPWIAEDRSHAEKVLFGQAYKVVHSTRPTVWFWDDFGQGANLTQAGYMQWSQARRVDNHVLPDHVSIVAATNRRGAGMGVNGVLEPVLGRFHCIDVEASLDDWRNWFIKNKEKQYPRALRVLAFLAFRPELINKPKDRVGDMVAWPSPRSNFALCRDVQLDLPQSLRYGAYTGSVGAGYAGEFVGFEKLYDQMPSLDAILADPTHFHIPDDPSTLWAVSVGLAAKANPNNFGRIIQYGERMQKEITTQYPGGKTVFAILMIRDAIRRDEKVCNTASYIKFASSDLGRAFRGEI